MPPLICHQLLLDCLRHQPAGACAIQLSGLPLHEWQELLEEARTQGVAPLLYHHLQRLSVEPPAEIQAALHQDSLSSASRNLRLYHELRKILPALQEAGLPVIALKGLHLAELVYPEPYLRPMGDMDLLLPRQHLGRALDIFTGLGYKSPRRVNIAHETNQHHHLPPLTRPDGGTVELHWTLISPGSGFNTDPSGLWARSQPAVLDGIPARVLCPEDLLLHLGLHFCSHSFRLSLRHLYDLLATLQHFADRIDWAALHTCSREWRAEKCLFLALYLAKELLDAPLPPGALEALQPADFTDQIAGLARQRLFDTRPTELHTDLAILWSKQPLSYKLRSAWMSLFPPPDTIAAKFHLPYPPASSPLQTLRLAPYYLLRLGRLSIGYSSQILAMLRHDPQTTSAARRENLLNDWWRTTGN